MRRRDSVQLRIIGDLNISPGFAAFGERVERLEGTDYRHYLGYLAQSDIAIAPLEATVFNDAKSNIKFLEASMLGLPSVVSGRRAFRDVVRMGENGFLAETEAEWLAALIAPVDDRSLRDSIGQAALQTVMARYDPFAVAREQMASLVRGLDQRRRRKLRVLAVNVFYWPRTYGGATIVAQEMARRLHTRPDTEVFFFTSQGGPGDQHELLRYADGDMTVIAAKLPAHTGDKILEFDNPELGQSFAEVLAAVEPDVVHFHCVQGLSASTLSVCAERGFASGSSWCAATASIASSVGSTSRPASAASLAPTISRSDWQF